MTEIVYQVKSQVTDDDLNNLFASAWVHHAERPFGPILAHSLTYVCAYHEGQLIGFVNVAWDGGIHGFILDTSRLNEQELRQLGVEARDSLVSDHLMLVADFAIAKCEKFR